MFKTRHTPKKFSVVAQTRAKPSSSNIIFRIINVATCGDIQLSLAGIGNKNGCQNTL
jgi:hypothetical protein